jgi:CopG family nickel-responsive transcriptional regulator
MLSVIRYIRRPCVRSPDSITATYPGPTMRRITISVEDKLAEQFDELIARHGYQNRSEAFRDLLRGRLENERKSTNEAQYCVANVSYIYNHHERELASRVATLQHDHHDICVSTMHVHLDHDNCLETLVLRGRYREVYAFANILIAQSGVRHGNIHIVPVEMDAPGTRKHTHFHYQPRT